MEDRTLDSSPEPRCLEALDLYSIGISDLRTEALGIAEDVLSRPASYWNSNPAIASGLLRDLERIELSESLLDTYKDIRCGPNE